MLSKILKRERFHPSFIGFFVNPNFIGRRSLMKKVTDMAPSIQGRVMDFGCGTQPYRSLFGHVADYVGVDIEVSGHDHGDSKVDVFYDGWRLPFGDDEFDAVVSFETFEHVVNIEQMLAEIARVVKPGGAFLLTTPFAYPEHEIPYDFRRLTRYGWAETLTRHGFEISRIEPTATFVKTLGQLWQTYLKSLSRGNRAVTTILNLLLGVPVLILTYIADFLLPRSETLFLNIAVLARRLPKIPQ